MSISKEHILSKVNSYEILNHYLQPFYGKGDLISGKNFSNPLISVKQETPSFNIFQDTANGEWRYKDFATGDGGSCFDLVMRLFNFTFSEALEKIYDDLCRNHDVSKQPFQLSKEREKIAVNYEMIKKSFDAMELSFWAYYGIDEATLSRFNVSSLEEYSSVTKAGKNYKISSGDMSFIFAYENNDWVKIYKPLDDKRYKFQHLGIKEPDFVFGWEQLPEMGDALIITGGEKDVMSLSARGYNAISLNSETASLDKEKAKQLKSRFKKIIVLYDNDETGLRQSKALAETYGFYQLVLPEFHNGGKDISDYFAQVGTTYDFNTLFSKASPTIAFEEDVESKIIYNAVELMESGNVETHYLMEPIFPQKGSAVLAGKPDTGKSQFARQLCIQVALGIKDFIGFEINPVHCKSIYIATEDNLEATRILLNKQMVGLGENVKENLRFMFADTMEQEDILNELDKALVSEPADLVVVDSFGDIFTGNDSNNNMVMRNTVKLFDKLAKKHNCLIMFVHHINKNAYRIAPGQEHIQGGSGLVQKVRLALILSEGEGSTRYLSVAKGNYCPKEYKENSLILHFLEETLLFENTGQKILTCDLGRQTKSSTNDKIQNELEEVAEAILGNQLMAYGEFVKQFMEISRKSVASAKRAIKSLLVSGFIEKQQGNYRLTIPNDDNEEEDVCGDMSA